MASKFGRLTNLPLPAPDVNDAPLVAIQINDAWLELLLSVASVLDDPETYVPGIDSDRAEQQAYLLYEQIRKAIAPEIMVYPTHATLWHDESFILTGGTLLSYSLADAPYNFYNVLSYQNPAVNGDSFKQSFMLAAGIYRFHATGITNTNCAKIDWYIDNTAIVTAQDWYSSPLVRNVQKVSVVTVPTSGLHTLKGVINGRATLASAWTVFLTKFWFDLTS